MNKLFAEDHSNDKAANQTLQRLVLEFAMLLCIAIAAEVFVFNIRAFSTAGYREQVIDGSYTVQISGGTMDESGCIVMDDDADCAVVDINGFDYPLKNVKLDVECIAKESLSEYIESICYVEVLPFDDALFEGVDSAGWSVMSNDAVTCVGAEIVHDIEASHYIYLKNYGNTHRLKLILYPSSDNARIFRLYGISFNVSQPMDIKPIRILVLFAVFVLLYFSLFNRMLWEEDCIALNGWKIAVVVVFLIIFFLASAVLILTNKSLMSDTFSPYAELARALCGGKLYVDVANSVVKDTEGIPIFWRGDSNIVKFDYALFEGKYYVYFGLLPCIVFYVPYYLVTGRDLPNAVPFISLRIIFTALIGLLLWDIIRKYYRKTPFAMFLLMWWAVIGGMYLPVMITTEVRFYDIPIFSGAVLSVLGTHFILCSCMEDNGPKISNIVLGSICFAAVSLCRPTMLLYGFVIMGCFILRHYQWAKALEKKALIKALSAVAVPYMFFAIVCMAYNVGRFGSPFDFGAAYNMTTYPVKDSDLFIPYVMYRAVYEYLLKPPVMDFGYPAAHFSSWTKIKEAGCLIVSGTFDGGLLMINPFVWTLCFWGHYREKLKEKGLKTLIPGLLLVAFMLMIFGCLFTSSMYTRYTLEFSPVILLSACVMIMEMQADVLSLNIERISSLFRICIAFVLLVSIFWGGLQMFCYSEGGMTVITGNPELWYRIINLFRGLK